MHKLIKIILVIILVVTAVSWLTTVAYGHNNGTLQIDGTVQDNPINVVPVSGAEVPSVAFFGNAIGKFQPGGLFYIESADITGDISVDLYITNLDQMAQFLRFLILKIDVYCETGPDEWQITTMDDGSPLPATYLTLRNGLVTYRLPGLARYKVAVSSGSYRSFPINAAMDATGPAFYLAAEPY